MGRYAVQLKPSADRSLARLPESVQRRILLAMTDLGDNPKPPGVKKLAGGENLWRVRVGDYRVVYEILRRPPLVMVLRVAHRKDVYRDK